MTNESQDIENMIAPSDLETGSLGGEDAIAKAVESAKIQSEAKDILSLTVGSLFAFFNQIFSPMFVSFAAQCARINASKSINK